MNRFWRWTTSARPYWLKDYKEGAIACAIFGVTGTSTMFLVRPAVENVTGIKGSWWEGPNSYRVVSILCVSPVYAVLLGITGTLAGRHNFFAKMSMKILGRFIPKPVISKAICNPAKKKVEA